jgi:hypothetical protein
MGCLSRQTRVFAVGWLTRHLPGEAASLILDNNGQHKKALPWQPEAARPML